MRYALATLVDDAAVLARVSVLVLFLLAANLRRRVDEFYLWASTGQTLTVQVVPCPTGERAGLSGCSRVRQRVVIGAGW